MDRSNLIARAVTLVAVAAAVVVVVIVAGGGKTYDLKLAMSNASGLRPGSEVLLGGVQVGSVNALSMSDDNHGNTVIADLHLNPSQVKIGQGVRASIIAANLLGEKYVALSPGNVNHPLQSGTTLPASATTPATDLDQIVDVLDGQTRARLAILLDEAGIAVDGRQSDVSAILRQFPLSLTAATKLLDTMVQNNGTLANLVQNSDQFITRVDDQSADLRRLIATSAGALKTFSDKAATLKQAVTGLAQPLAEFTRWFSYGATIFSQLEPEVNEITTAAPRLTSLLQEVKPFTQAAVPALNKAASVAPTLTSLAAQATPTIARAVPTLSSLQNIARLANPLSAWLGLSSVDLDNIPGDWAGAVQTRDAASHIFGANVFINPDIVLTTANLGASADQRRQNLLDIKSLPILRLLGLLGAQQAARAAQSAPAAKAPTTHQAAPTSNPVKVTPPKLPSLGGGSSTTPTSKPTLGSTLSSTVGGLLSGVGNLLGGGHHTSPGTSASSGATGATGNAGTTGLGSALKGLVGYLLGK